jgi:hypothetical protein
MLSAMPMPTVLRKNGFDVIIRFNDHDPPHVHLTKGSGEVVVGLTPVKLERVWNLKRHDALIARRIVTEHREYLLKLWIEIHGEQEEG